MKKPWARGGRVPTSSRQTFDHPVSQRQMAEYRTFMRTAPADNKNFVKEVAGEQYMERAAELRGLTTTVTPADKGVRGGPDADMRDRFGHQSRGEAKAEHSRLSPGQSDPAKTLVTDPNKVLNREGQFTRASPMDQRAAAVSQKTLNNGGTVSRDVYRTRQGPGGFRTTVTSRTYALPETGTQGGPVTVTRDPSLKTGGFARPGRATLPIRNATTGPTGGNSPDGGHAVAGRHGPHTPSGKF